MDKTLAVMNGNLVHNQLKFVVWKNNCSFNNKDLYKNGQVHPKQCNVG
jgi:hypothetical protein